MSQPEGDRRHLLLEQLLALLRTNNQYLEPAVLHECVKQLDMYTPSDFANPEWSKYSMVHGWRNYIDESTRKLWPSLPPITQVLLAVNAAHAASTEQWD